MKLVNEKFLALFGLLTNFRKLNLICLLQQIVGTFLRKKKLPNVYL